MQTITRTIRPAALAAGILAVLWWPAAGVAQIDPRQPKITPADVSGAAPELEIYQVRNSETVPLGGTLRVILGVTNNGKIPGEFDYALGPQGMNAVWWRDSGSRLGAGERNLGAFSVSHKDLLRHFGTKGGGGTKRTCLGLYLVRKGSTTSWTDADNPNHQKQVCFNYYFPPN